MWNYVERIIWEELVFMLWSSTKHKQKLIAQIFRWVRGEKPRPWKPWNALRPWKPWNAQGTVGLVEFPCIQDHPVLLPHELCIAPTPALQPTQSCLLLTWVEDPELPSCLNFNRAWSHRRRPAQCCRTAKGLVAPFVLSSLLGCRNRWNLAQTLNSAYTPSYCRGMFSTLAQRKIARNGLALSSSRKH